jgi:hypothetical protein
VLLATNAFIYFKEYEEDKQSLTYPSEKLVETVCASISLLESKMSKVAHTGSVEEKMAVAVKETIDFEWIGSSGCSLHSQKNNRWFCERYYKNCFSIMVQGTNRSMSEGSRHRATKRKLTILSHKYVSRKVMPLSFFPTTNCVSSNSLTLAHHVCCKPHHPCDKTVLS